MTTVAEVTSLEAEVTSLEAEVTSLEAERDESRGGQAFHRMMMRPFSDALSGLS